MAEPAVRLYVGGHATSVQGERQTLTGDRMFTAANRPHVVPFSTAALAGMHAILDSGAFSDAPADRLTPAAALERQLAWELKASAQWGGAWRAEVLVTYDLLIDETWSGRERRKRRWTAADAEDAVDVTIAAAAYLAGARARLAPRRLLLSCQGVNAVQYRRCLDGVLAVAQPVDWLGLGGWCVLGRFQRLLPEFWATLRLCLPAAAAAGLRHVHIFGVLWQPALAGLCWLADQVGMTVSTDSTAPVLACTRRDPKKAGVRAPYWRDNVEHWRATLATLRDSPLYREPALPAHQWSLFEAPERNDPCPSPTPSPGNATRLTTPLPGPTLTFLPTSTWSLPASSPA